MCIDGDQTLFELLFEFGSVLSNRLCEERQARVGKQGVCVLPSLIVQEIIFKTATADAVAAKDITGFKAMPEQPLHEELITVCQQLSVFTRPGSIQIAFGRVRYETPWECPSRILTERSSFRKGGLEKLDGFDQRRLRGG